MSAPIKAAMHLYGYGGVEPAAHDAVFAELITPNNLAWAHRVVFDDALIERSRSVNLSRALKGGADVVCMVDHDLTWKPGDLAALAEKAYEENAIVGGLYACRGYKAGFSSRLAAQGVPWTPGGDKLHSAEYVATGFIAIPRRCAERIIAVCTRPDATPEMRIQECIGVDRPEVTFWDFFRSVSMPCTMEGYEDKYEFLSEDWSFAARARYSDVPLFVWEKPTLKHWGKHAFTVEDGLRGLRPGEQLPGRGSGGGGS